MHLRAYQDGIIFTGEAWVEGHALITQNGRILDIVPNGKAPANAETLSHKDKLLTPGFIDAQVNGGGNIQFNNAPTVESAIAIANAHARYGTTGILLTLITDTPEITRKAIHVSREACKRCPNIMGIHLEGPHLAVERRGVHNADYIRDLTTDDLSLYKPEAGEVMLVTVAPETVSHTTIKALREQGVVVSIGHTNALPEQIHAAIEAGATGFTHLFNGMGKPSAGGTTPADTALKEKSAWAGIIMDGFHVPDDMAKLALKEKPGKLFLVSDAMAPAAAENPQSFTLYGDKIDVTKDGGNWRCVNHESKLAGSSITMLDAVRHCVNSLGVPLEEALRMASTYPALFLGIADKYGKLLPNYSANVTILDTSLTTSITA